MKQISCGSLRASNVGETVDLLGWVHTIRDHKDTFFIDLRDWEGITQIVTHKSKLKDETIELLTNVLRETVLKVTGEVKKRPPGTENKKLLTGEIEVEIKDVEILNECAVLPYHFKDYKNTAIQIRLKYRYVDLRNPIMLNNIITRGKVTNEVHRYMEEQGFIDIETPMLTKSTPEGARDYLVPSRVHQGKFYALPQSPQLFKQMLMCSGIEKYYQIARCFRDEDLRPERQPEFTQIDIEMAFIEQEDIINVVEGLLKRVFEKIKGIKVKTPFPRMNYKEAMTRFGTDKPDTRFGMELHDITDVIPKDTEIFQTIFDNNGIINAIKVDRYAKISNKKFAKLRRYVRQDFKAKDLAQIALKEKGTKSALKKYLDEKTIEKIIKAVGAKKGDNIFIIGDADKSIVYQALGELRLRIAEELEIIPKDEFNFLWIVDFPLFEWDYDEQRWTAMHHPFTSPKAEFIDSFDEDPESALANAYDIVLNGYELGGGSIRIHNPEVQERMFKTLNIPPEIAKINFEFLIEALKYGAPPHGGLAIGLDRLIMLLVETDNIRDVIAFPKTRNAKLPIGDAPSRVTTQQLDDLGIQIKPEVLQLLEEEKEEKED
ncbi:MAG: aspartate--tRNA ligase [Candidatus Lokiarchaeota archaeon]|nr:aspartate--tRNA ligase [Candidatus Lokiarchaeota archaeon]